MLLGQLTQQGEIALTRQHQPHISRNRLNDDGGNMIALTLHHIADGSLIVVRNSNRVRRCPLRHTGRTRDAEGRHA